MKSFQLPELRVVAQQIPGTASTDRAPTEIYRPFFVAGILSVLTAGCLLGAVALLGIALNSSYTVSAWTPYILAHANSQLYGWVGFFVMGFSMQQHAPTVATKASFFRLAYGAMVLMGLGIAVRFAAEPLVAVDRGLWIPIGMAACWAQAAAVLLYLYNITFNRFRSGGKMPWQSILVLGSLSWLLAVTLAEPFFFVASHGTDPQARILFIAEWFVPYRDAQFLGFVASMVFGVALVKMYTCFGAQEACPKLGLGGYAVWTVGLLARMGGWVYAFQNGLEGDSRLIYHAGGLLLAAGAVMMVLATRMFSTLDIAAPSQKFVRAAFSWLILGGVLIAVEPLHLAAIGNPFSHAYLGAIRHAITVGFISQMIVGVGMHVAARMNDIPARYERPLWATFWLLNLGNAARVGLEIATDYSPGAFLPMGITGFVELAGLALWAAYMLRTMLRPKSLVVA